ncbi:MAG: hypothetical protein CMF40_05925, partial [Legionellales bacterium]|nr:hypothetical protein [Legionellales bacterium]
MKIAILSDIHANIYAFNAVLDVIKKEGIEKIIVAGDLIGYYYWPREVIDICMRNDDILCIKGNHEKNFMMALSDPECMSAAIEKYGTSYRIASETLSQDQIKWLDSLPYVLDINLDNRTFYVTHGSLESIDEYIYPDESRDTLLNQMSDSDYTILGHTHYPFICSNNDKWLINPGSVGQPRDYCASASFFIVNLK